MYEDVLVLGLDEEGALVADVAEVGLDVDLALGAELPQHRVNHDVGARAPHARAAVHNNLDGDNIFRATQIFLCSFKDIFTGPLSGASADTAEDFLMKLRTGVMLAAPGVPWSGQLVYWNCTTSRGTQLSRALSRRDTRVWRMRSVRTV